MAVEKRDGNRKLGVGVVGLGRMGRHHALNILHRVPRATLVCACSPMQTDLVWADEHLVPHGTRVVPTFEEMIETGGLDAVIIASATPFHASQTTAALKKGIHVLCEKPVCQSLGEVSDTTCRGPSIANTVHSWRPWLRWPKLPLPQSSWLDLCGDSMTTTGKRLTRSTKMLLGAQLSSGHKAARH